MGASRPVHDVASAAEGGARGAHVREKRRSQRLEYSARLTQALLAEIARVCQENGSDFVAFYHGQAFPQIPDEPTRFEVEGRCVTLSGESARALVHEVLSGCPTLMVEGVPPDATVSRSDRHLNSSATKYVMGALARWLVALDSGGLARLAVRPAAEARRRPGAGRV